MKKYLGLVLVGAMAAFGAGCSDDESTPATGGTGGNGTGGNGGGGGGGDCVILIGEDSDEISTDTSWDRPECDYVLTQIIYVTGATLTISPGVTVKGDNGSALIVARDGSIDAQGTANDPIVMTSSRLEGQRDRGDWGGLALLGSAFLNRGIGTCDGPSGDCEDALEGLETGEPRALFGGDDDASDCGTLRYVRIEFAGFEIAPNNELNGLTLAGCGTGTELEYIQVHRGLDDGVEFFGGSASISKVIVDGMGDDGIDWDQGFTGSVMNFISHHYAGRTDDPRGIEADNAGSNTSLEPRSNPTVAYGTVVADPGDTQVDQGVVLRRGTWGDIDGLVVEGYRQAGIDIRDDGWINGAWPTDLSVEMSCFNDNDPEYPTDVNCELGTDDDDDPVTTGDEDCNDFNAAPGSGGEDDEANYFAENTEMADAARNNAIVDPDTGDYSPAATGGTPDYTVNNEDCMGAFASDDPAEDGVDWTAGWTAFPVD